MKVSVCNFTYNHERYIGEALESVLSQKTSFDYEIVVGEDCSTDRTREVVAAYQKKYPDRIRAIFNERNLGMMGNNSQTILQCRGEYIALLDGDDYWINDMKLQTQVDFLEANPQYVFCFHNARVLRTNGQWDKKTCCGAIKKSTISFTDIICDVDIPTNCLVFRRNALGGYPPDWFSQLNAPDRPLFLLVASKGIGYYFNELWSVYRKHPNGSWTGQHYQSQWLTCLQIYSVINRHFKKVYNKPFCKCEAWATYMLAIRLVRDNKRKRAICYIRKYRRITHGLASFKPDVYYKMLVFTCLLVKSKTGSLLNL